MKLLATMCLLLSVNAMAISKLTVPDILDASALKDGHDGKPAVDPCQDFYRFSCGAWLEQTEIPADKVRVSHAATALADQTDGNLNKLLVRLEAGDKSLQTPAAKQLVDYYHTCMNFTDTAPAATQALHTELATIEKLTDKKDLATLVAQLQLNGTNVFFNFGSGQDLHNSIAVIGFFDQGGMGLPEPSYYFEKSKKATETRKKYIEHIDKILQLVGQGKALAKKNADVIMHLETALAEKAYTFSDREDPGKINHPSTRADLAKMVPNFNWNDFFGKLEAPQSVLNINEPEFFTHFNEVLATTSLNDLKTYLQWQVIHRDAAMISPQFEQENFKFWQKYLHGQKAMKPRWKICTQAIERELGYAMAEVYVKTVDTVAIRKKIEDMIAWIKETFRKDLADLSSGSEAWLDVQTRDEAIRKLDKLGQKLGAPEKWRDYGVLQTDRSSYLINDLKTMVFESKRDLKKIGKPVDRLEWDMMPWEINAYYDPPKNEFVFPFGILQPPSFDVKASDGANLGAFGGGTIGHELTHGYDNNGRQYDASGNLKDWWSEATAKHFAEKSQCFIKQADAYKIKEAGLNVDGKQSLSENLADQGGVKLGYVALLLVQSKRPPAAQWHAKYTENQQFWLSYAQSWCTKTRSETLRVLIKTNPHPPEEFRVNGVVMNRPEFAKDFNCKVGTPMAPKVRCSIW